VEAPARPPAPARLDWQPPEALLAPEGPDLELRRLGETRAGFVVTSYSAVKRRRGGFVAADADGPAANEPGADAAVVDGALPPDELPRGRLSGTFLHEVLEEVDLEPLRARPLLHEWQARPEIVDLFERLGRRHDRRPAHLPNARRLVHTALTAPVRLGNAVIPGLASATQTLREMEFLYPIPERAQPSLGSTRDDARTFRIERGVVKGFVDLLFEHDGRAYVCDWKGDWLPSWEPALVDAHAMANYDIQARLYTLAALRMLGLDGPEAYARFGGVLYCFLRGMRPDDPGAGIHFRRPSWAEVVGWEREMLGGAFWGIAELK
jgi:exodeoxyribonuclease V beta subunit